MLIIHFVTEKVDAMVDGGMTKTKIISALCTGALDVIYIYSTHATKLLDGKLVFKG